MGRSELRTYDRISTHRFACSTPPTAMIALPSLSLVSLLLGTVAASSTIPSECTALRIRDQEACQQPIDDVIAVTNDSYAAKIRCPNGPYYTRVEDERKLVFGDYDLVGVQQAE
jgi:hypothetical protein